MTPSALARLRRLAARLFREKRGNVAMLSAIIMVPIMLALGMGVDYGFQRGRQDQLQGVADAAALAAVTPSMMLNTSTAAKTAAQNIWNGESSTISGLSNLSATITVTDTNGQAGGTQRNVTISYSAKSLTIFGGLVGFSSLPISGASTSTMSSTPYINIYVVVDNSQSMGIGSTQNDMINLYNVTQQYNGDGCVFGCHVRLVSNNEPYSDEYLAHNNGVTLRIDSAKSAVTSMISQANTQNMSSFVKFALYTMGGGSASSSTLLKQVAALSNNYSSLTTNVSTIDLETQSAQGVIGDTDIEDALTSLMSSLPSTNGTGMSASSPMNFVFIVSDGLDDFNYYDPPLPYLNNSSESGGGYRSTQALPNSVCTTLQQRANIGVIYTTYLPLYTNPNFPSQGYYTSYTDLVQPYTNAIPTNLQNCATNSNYYLVASDGPSIVSAMQKLFSQALMTAHLTS